jgi:hypothetical protein
MEELIVVERTGGNQPEVAGTPVNNMKGAVGTGGENSR